MINIVKANLFYWIKTVWMQLILMIVIIGYCLWAIQADSKTHCIDSFGQLYDVCKLNNIFILQLFLLFFASNSLVLVLNYYLQNIVIRSERRWKVCLSMYIGEIIEISISYFIVYICVFGASLFVTNIDILRLFNFDFFKVLIIKWLSLVEMTIIMNATVFLTRRALLLYGSKFVLCIYFFSAGVWLVDAKEKYEILKYHVPLQYMMNYTDTMRINLFLNILIRIGIIVCVFFISAIAFRKKDLVRIERKEY